MSSPFHIAFREELLEAAQRASARRRRRFRLGLGALFAAVLGTLAWLVPDPVAADVSVRVVDGFVEVTLRGPVDSNDEILDALERHDIDAAVRSVPTGPSAVGRFISVEADGAGSPSDVEMLDPHGPAFGGFRLREGIDTGVTIGLGRPAEPGEPYEAYTNPFDQGEPLHCRGVLGQTLADAAEHVDGLTITVRFDEPIGTVIMSLDDALRDGFGTTFVVGGSASSANDVQLRVVPEASAPESGC